jgi:hypothetical protein
LPAVELFVDVSRRRDYLLCAAVVAAGDINTAPKTMRDSSPTTEVVST